MNSSVYGLRVGVGPGALDGVQRRRVHEERGHVPGRVPVDRGGRAAVRVFVASRRGGQHHPARTGFSPGGRCRADGCDGGEARPARPPRPPRPHQEWQPAAWHKSSRSVAATRDSPPAGTDGRRTLRSASPAGREPGHPSVTRQKRGQLRSSAVRWNAQAPVRSSRPAARAGSRSRAARQRSCPSGHR